MKKILALILAFALLACMLTACKKTKKKGSGGGLFDDLGDDADESYMWYESDAYTESNWYTESESPAIQGTDRLEGQNGETLKYVLIYNPGIYNEEDGVYNQSLSTGDFGMQVDTDGFRGGELETDKPVQSWDQGQWGKNIPWNEFNAEGNRGDGLSPSYKKGDHHIFYTMGYYDFGETRIRRDFACMYAGTFCNIWVSGLNLSQSLIDHYGREFDQRIYTGVTEAFGTPRFDGNINILVYPFSEDGIAGYFYGLDLFATGEYSQSIVEGYGINLDHNILNLNGTLLQAAERNDELEFFMQGTMAHELQHLIAFTDSMATFGGDYSYSTWLNEAMSGYIEEQLYPGTMEVGGRYSEYLYGTSIRHGQSLYNFSTDLDIGVYGSVYLFSEYLANLGGDDIFSKIHNYWRTSYSYTLSDAEAIAKAVPASVYAQINQSVSYPGSVYFENSDWMWLSKLTLQFYLATLAYDRTDPAAFSNLIADAMLYDEINAANIEGGGRILIAVRNGVFEIPEDADSGLIYIGLNSDFEVITDMYYN